MLKMTAAESCRLPDNGFRFSGRPESFEKCSAPPLDQEINYRVQSGEKEMIKNQNGESETNWEETFIPSQGGFA